MPNSIPFQNTLTIIHLRTFDRKIVLQSLFSRHSRMCMLLGVLEWQFYQCSRMPLNSCFKNAAPKKGENRKFQNAKVLMLQEWFVFCSGLMFDILECKDMSYSRNGERQGFQNALKSRDLEHWISRHSRMAQKCYFQSILCSEILLFLPFWNG